MSRTKLALFALSALIVAIFVISCEDWEVLGEQDPALAPAGSQVKIIATGTEEAWVFSCHPDSGLPITCDETWIEYIKAYCINDQMSDDTPTGSDVENCINNGGDPYTCAEIYCEDQKRWIDYTQMPSVLNKARVDISSIPGACGYNNSIIRAFAIMPGSEGGEGGHNEGMDGSILYGTPLNGIQLRFVALGGELYKLSDVPSQVPPLANPYVSKTDKRGKSEIKYRTPLPRYCNSAEIFFLEADIGVSISQFKVEYQVTAGTDTTTTDDDDDDDDNDDDAADDDDSAS